MFNFQNLTDHEFENLSKDILENETNKEFRVYAPGRDGGIDIATYESSGVIGQCKHYLDSSFSTLKSSLKKELIKLETIQPNEYFLFISKKLTQRNIMDIYTIFNDYMSSPNNIYDGSRLDQLLQLDEYKDIVRTHYKLWLVSTNVLELTLNQKGLSSFLCKFVLVSKMLSNPVLKNEDEFIEDLSPVMSGSIPSALDIIDA